MIINGLAHHLNLDVPADLARRGTAGAVALAGVAPRLEFLELDLVHHLFFALSEGDVGDGVDGRGTAAAPALLGADAAAKGPVAGAGRLIADLLC